MTARARYGAVAVPVGLALAGVGALWAQPAGGACTGGIAGTTVLWDSVEVAYHVAVGGRDARLQTALVARAPAGWWDQPPPPRPDLRDARGRPRLTTGGAFGPVWVHHEPGAGRTWVGARPLTLGRANVLLLQADGGRAEPRVVGTAAVGDALPIPPGACGRPGGAQAHAAFERALRAALERTPAIRAFVGPHAAP